MIVYQVWSTHIGEEKGSEPHDELETRRTDKKVAEHDRPADRRAYGAFVRRGVYAVTSLGRCGYYRSQQIHATSRGLREGEMGTVVVLVRRVSAVLVRRVSAAAAPEQSAGVPMKAIPVFYSEEMLAESHCGVLVLRSRGPSSRPRTRPSNLTYFRAC